MSRIRTAISLFAAATLCVGVLAGCQSQTSTQADSQSTQQTEAQQTEAQQTETQSTSQSSKQEEKNTSQTSTEASSQNATTPEPEPEPAPASAPTDAAGRLQAVCMNDPSSGYPCVTDATLEGDVLTLQGSMSQGDDRVDGPIVLTVSDSTEWYASGGLAGKSSVEPSFVLDCINSHNGLGLAVDVQDGVATSVGVVS